MNILADSYRFKKLSEADRVAIRDMSSQEVLKYLHIKAWKLPLIVREARLELQKRIETMQPFEGIREVFAELAAEKIPTWILTSNSRANVDAFLAKEKIAVDKVFCESSIFGKGNLLRGLLKREKISAEQPIVFVGDESRDVEAARKSGVFAAAVTWGYNSETLLKKYDPDYLLQNPRDILSLLKLEVKNIFSQEGFDL